MFLLVAHYSVKYLVIIYTPECGGSTLCCNWLCEKMMSELSSGAMHSFVGTRAVNLPLWSQVLQILLHFFVFDPEFFLLLLFRI